jgi:hypothetical protein
VDRDAGAVDSTGASLTATSGGLGAAIAALRRRVKGVAGGDGGCACRQERREGGFRSRQCLAGMRIAPQFRPRNRSSTGWEAAFTNPLNIFTIFTNIQSGVALFSAQNRKGTKSRQYRVSALLAFAWE